MCEFFCAYVQEQKGENLSGVVCVWLCLIVRKEDLLYATEDVRKKGHRRVSPCSFLEGGAWVRT